MTAHSRYEVDPGSVAKEVGFYDKATDVYDRLERAKKSLLQQQREFEALFQYYVRNRGHLDLEYRSAFRPGMERPNLGTTDPSWYYVDERGNKIWVRNVTLDTARAQAYAGAGTKFTGAFEETQFSNGQHVVVKIPNPKRHYGLESDYRRRCVEAESEWALRSGLHGVPGIEVAALSTGWSASPYAVDAGERGSSSAYEESQRQLLRAIRDGRERSPTFRLPTTIEEAEERLRELKAEEQAILQSIT